MRGGIPGPGGIIPPIGIILLESKFQETKVNSINYKKIFWLKIETILDKRLDF